MKLRELMRKTKRYPDKPRKTAAHELPTLPGVSALSLATRYLEGGRARFLQFVQLAVLNRSAHAEAWWAVFLDLTPYERAKVSYDDICAASGVAPYELMAALVSAGMQHSVDTGNLVYAAMHPEIVAAATTSAKRIDGDFASIALEDRRMLLQHQGFVPIPKGMQVHVHANASASAQAAAAAASEPSVPAFSADMEALTMSAGGMSGERQSPHQLGEADPTLAPIDVTAVPASVPADV